MQQTMVIKGRGDEVTNERSTRIRLRSVYKPLLCSETGRTVLYASSLRVSSLLIIYYNVCIEEVSALLFVGFLFRSLQFQYDRPVLLIAAAAATGSVKKSRYDKGKLNGC